MLNMEFILAVLMLIQPPIFGFIFFAVARSGVAAKFFFSFLKTTRKRHKSVKFFECAVYARLVNSIQYDIFVLSFCVLFILYDVDLIFFFTEAICIEHWSTFEVVFIFINLLLFIFGLWYDYIRLGFNWSH
jgi:NADH:ubiquinone oxidoreductase subunit 3 (subunit A)